MVSDKVIIASVSNPKLTPELVLWAYAQGAFPMARSRRGQVEWFSPDPRAVLPLDGLKVTPSLARRVRSGRFAVRFDSDFATVIRLCSQPRPQQHETWISPAIERVYTQLHHLDHAHSVEAYREGQLVGGLYGVNIGGAFFGESMFSLQSDASKVCLVHLVHHLRRRGYRLLDVQLQSPHMQRMGAVEIPRDEYLPRLAQAIALPVTWS